MPQPHPPTAQIPSSLAGEIQRSIEALEQEYQSRRAASHRRSLPGSVSKAYRLVIAGEMEKLARLQQLAGETADPY
jgi:hypothetical protein